MSNLSELNGTYTIDPAHSTVGFVARHAVITKVRGSFTDVEGSATINGTDLAASSVQVSLKVASIDTRQQQRDEHLRSADFFDAEQFPAITFTSTSVQAQGNEVEVTGELTIKDVTRQVSIPLEYTGSALDVYGNSRVGFEGRVDINRKDFGLTWNAALETGGVLVSEKIGLEFDLSLIKNA